MRSTISIMAVLLLAACFSPAAIFAQDDENLSKMLSGNSPDDGKGLATGINGAVPMDVIMKALEGTKKNMGAELKASDADYAQAAGVISKNSVCTDAGCEISGDDTFLGKDTKLDASIKMVDTAGGEKGLTIALKLIDAKTGKVIKTVTEPFDASDSDSLNTASLRAAKEILAGVSSRGASKNAKTSADTAVSSSTDTKTATPTASEEYTRHYVAGNSFFKAGKYSNAAKEFMKAYEIKPTPLAKKRMNEALDKISAQAQ